MKAVSRLIVAALMTATVTIAPVNADKKPQRNNEAARARGLFIHKTSDAMSITVMKNEGGTMVPVDPSREFKAGDQIKVSFESNFDGFIYVVNIQPSGKRCVLFPYAGAANNAVRSDERYDIPPGGAAIEFDKEKGIEVLQVIMSRERIAYLDAALKEPEGCLSESVASVAAELQGGIAKKVTPVVPQNETTKVRSRDIILAPGKDKDKTGSVVAVPDTGGGGKLKPGEIAPFELRLKHN